MIAFAFLYRFGYGLLDKMGPLFLIDSRANHGLGLSNQAVGGVYGTFGSGAFIVGSLLGGFIVSRAGLKKTLLLLCLCINVPNATFLFLSQVMPTDMSIITAVASSSSWLGHRAMAHDLHDAGSRPVLTRPRTTIRHRVDGRDDEQ